VFSKQQSGSQLENIPWWGKNSFGGSKRTIYNKINNNSEHFRGQDWC